MKEFKEILENIYLKKFKLKISQKLQTSALVWNRYVRVFSEMRTFIIS